MIYKKKEEKDLLILVNIYFLSFFLELIIFFTNMSILSYFPGKMATAINETVRLLYGQNIAVRNWSECIPSLCKKWLWLWLCLKTAKIKWRPGQEDQIIAHTFRFLRASLSRSHLIICMQLSHFLFSYRGTLSPTPHPLSLSLSPSLYLSFLFCGLSSIFSSALCYSRH